MKDIKEKVEEMEREVFELKALDVEDAAFHTLGCIKSLRSSFLLLKAREMTEENVRNVLKDLDDAVKCLQESFYYLKDWMEKYVLKKEVSEE